MEVQVLGIKLEGKREDLQWIQGLVPIRHLSFNRNVCGLRRCLRVGYNDKDFPLQKTIFLDVWHVNGLKDYENNQKPSRHQGIVKDEPVTWTSTCCSDSPRDSLPWDSIWVLFQDGSRRISQKKGLTYPRRALWDAEGPGLE